MEQLTKFQVTTLRKLANGGVKLFTIAIPKDNLGFHKGLTTQFNEMLRLVELGLVDDVTDAFPNLVAEYSGDGGEVVVTRLMPQGQAMFERHYHDQFTN